jgi:uncharacterized protein YcfJ
MIKSAIAAAVAAASFAPLASQAAEYANVIASTPVVQQVNVPQRVCSQEQALVGARPSGAGAVIGAVAGGLLGNAIGAGTGVRAAATGLGVVAGAAVGNGVETNAAANVPPAAVPVERCRVENRLEARTVGYDVVYEYNGQRYNTRVANDPGDRIRIDVRPTQIAQAGPEAAPPAYDSAPPAYSSTPGYASAPAYPGAPVYAPVPVYSAPPVVYSPYYYPGPAVYVAPTIGFGFYGGGWHGGHGGRHWH